jgi:NAD(P)-dependent dehydrogenase (short-subunit alcohol dehydrogenase family)
MRVALIGAGRMGSAMGARVADAGHELVVFNRTRPKAEELAQRTGAQVADTAREAAEFAEVCLVSLADDEAVATTYLAVDGCCRSAAGRWYVTPAPSPRRQSAGSPPSRNREDVDHTRCPEASRWSSRDHHGHGRRRSGARSGAGARSVGKVDLPSWRYR